MPSGIYPRKSTEERFEEKYIPVTESGCWIWIASLFWDGYGQFNFSGTMVRSHRYSYERKYGPIPDGLELDHLCRIRCCVNPDHVEPVTHLVNVQRGKHFNTNITRCKRGHELGGDNTYSGAGRKCKLCTKRRTEIRKYGFVITDELKD